MAYCASDFRKKGDQIGRCVMFETKKKYDTTKNVDTTKYKYIFSGSKHIIKSSTKNREYKWI